VKNEQFVRENMSLWGAIPSEEGASTPFVSCGRFMQRMDSPRTKNTQISLQNCRC